MMWWVFGASCIWVFIMPWLLQHENTTCCGWQTAYGPSGLFRFCLCGRGFFCQALFARYVSLQCLRALCRPSRRNINHGQPAYTVSFKHDVDDTILLSFVTQGLGQVTWLLQQWCTESRAVEAWQEIADNWSIPNYIDRGHRTLKLQEPYCLDIGVATCGRPCCPGWQSHPCDLCREGWNMAPAAALTLRASAKTVALQLVCSEQECRVRNCASRSSRNCCEHCTLLFLLLPPPHRLLPLCTTLMTGQTLMPVSLWIFAKSI